MSTKTPFSIVATRYGSTEIIATKSRKDLAIKFAVAQDADAVWNPKGEVIWTNPALDAVEAEVAQDEAVEDNDTMTTATTETVEEGTTKTRKRATRAKAQPATATTGRFLLETYGSEGETTYANRPDAHLRLILGIKWRELWALGFTQKAATAALAGMADGTIDPDAFRDEQLAKLDEMAEEGDE